MLCYHCLAQLRNILYRQLHEALMRTRNQIALSAVLLLSALGCRELATDDPSAASAPRPEDRTVLSASTLAGWQEVIVDQTSFTNPWGKGMGDVNGDGLPDLLFGD